jgi:hypothetical protein
LVLKLGEGVPHNSPDGLLIKGTIKEPVWWDYTITMTEQDLIDLFRVAVNKETVVYLQTVERPWKLLGTLIVAMSKFLGLWLVERARWYWLRGLAQKEDVAGSE